MTETGVSGCTITSTELHTSQVVNLVEQLLAIAVYKTGSKRHLSICKKIEHL